MSKDLQNAVHNFVLGFSLGDKIMARRDAAAAAKLKWDTIAKWHEADTAERARRNRAYEQSLNDRRGLIQAQTDWYKRRGSGGGGVRVGGGPAYTDADRAYAADLGKMGYPVQEVPQSPSFSVDFPQPEPAPVPEITPPSDSGSGFNPAMLMMDNDGAGAGVYQAHGGIVPAINTQPMDPSRMGVGGTAGPGSGFGVRASPPPGYDSNFHRKGGRVGYQQGGTVQRFQTGGTSSKLERGLEGPAGARHAYETQQFIQRLLRYRAAAMENVFAQTTPAQRAAIAQRIAQIDQQIAELRGEAAPVSRPPPDYSAPPQPGAATPSPPVQEPAATAVRKMTSSQVLPDYLQPPQTDERGGDTQAANVEVPPTYVDPEDQFAAAGRDSPSRAVTGKEKDVYGGASNRGAIRTAAPWSPATDWDKGLRDQTRVAAYNYDKDLLDPYNIHYTTREGAVAPWAQYDWAARWNNQNIFGAPVPASAPPGSGMQYQAGGMIDTNEEIMARNRATYGGGSGGSANAGTGSSGDVGGGVSGGTGGIGGSATGGQGGSAAAGTTGGDQGEGIGEGSGTYRRGGRVRRYQEGGRVQRFQEGGSPTIRPEDSELLGQIISAQVGDPRAANDPSLEYRERYAPRPTGDWTQPPQPFTAERQGPSADTTMELYDRNGNPVTVQVPGRPSTQANVRATPPPLPEYERGWPGSTLDQTGPRPGSVTVGSSASSTLPPFEPQRPGSELDRIYQDPLRQAPVTVRAESGADRGWQGSEPPPGSVESRPPARRPAIDTSRWQRPEDRAFDPRTQQLDPRSGMTIDASGRVTPIAGTGAGGTGGGNIPRDNLPPSTEPMGGTGMNPQGVNAYGAGLSTNNAANDMTAIMQSASDFAAHTFHLNKNDQHSAGGYHAVMAGHGAAPINLIEAGFQKIDPQGRMPMNQKIELLAQHTFDYYASQGQPERAAKVAFEIAQFGNVMAKQHAKQAGDILQNGNIPGAAQELVNGYNWLVDGHTADYDQRSNSITLRDAKTGQPTGRLPVTPQLVEQLVYGMMSGELNWNIMKGRGAASLQGAMQDYNAGVDRMDRSGVQRLPSRWYAPGQNIPPTVPNRADISGPAVQQPAAPAGPPTAEAAPQGGAAPPNAGGEGGGEQSRGIDPTQIPGRPVQQPAYDPKTGIFYNPNMGRSAPATSAPAKPPASTTQGSGVQVKPPPQITQGGGDQTQTGGEPQPGTDAWYEKHPHETPPGRPIMREAPDLPTEQEVQQQLNNSRKQLEEIHAQRIQQITGLKQEHKNISKQGKAFEGQAIAREQQRHKEEVAKLEGRAKEARDKIRQFEQQESNRVKEWSARSQNSEANLKTEFENYLKPLKDSYDAADPATMLDKIKSGQFADRNEVVAAQKFISAHKSPLRYMATEDDRAGLRAIASQILKRNPDMDERTAVDHALRFTTLVGPGEKGHNQAKGDEGTWYRRVGTDTLGNIVIADQRGNQVHVAKETLRQIENMRRDNAEDFKHWKPKEKPKPPPDMGSRTLKEIGKIPFLGPFGDIFTRSTPTQ